MPASGWGSSIVEVRPYSEEEDAKSLNRMTLSGESHTYITATKRYPLLYVKAKKNPILRLQIAKYQRNITVQVKVNSAHTLSANSRTIEGKFMIMFPNDVGMIYKRISFNQNCL